MFPPMIASLTLLGFRIRSIEEMAIRLVAGNPTAWAQAIAAAAVIFLLLCHQSTRR